VEIYGDEEHPTNKGSFCPKGMLTHFHPTNPNRITEPAMRESLTAPFKKVTWDEAIAFVSGKLSEITATSGKNSIFIHGSETDPFGYIAGSTWFAKNYGLINTPTRFFPRPFTSNGIIKKIFGIPASMLSMNAPRDWCRSQCILLYGCDLASSDPVTFGPILDARDRGATILVIDSRKTVTASKATFSLRVKPGSESVALKGILHFLIRKGMVLEEFLLESTEGFGSLKSELESFPVEAAARECWVDPKDIEHAADLIGRVSPIQVIAGDWNSRRFLTDEDLLLSAAVVCARGSVGIPGGGLNLLNSSPFLWESRLAGNGPETAVSEEEGFFINLEDIGSPGHENVGALICRGNPWARLADGKKTKAALGAIPLIVHLSSYPNETFNQAHVSLPVSSWLECSSLVSTNNGRAIQWQHKVVEPPGSCRSPLQFWADLARASGIGDSFPWKESDGAVDPAKVADFFLMKNPLTEAIRVQHLDPENHPPGGILWPCVDDAELTFEDSRLIKGNVRGRNILFQRNHNFPSSDKRFPTPTGKITFSDSFNTAKAGSCYASKNLYPLMLVTGVLVDMTEEFEYFLADRRSGSNALIVKIHPRLGRLIGVSNGESLTVESDRGAFNAPAWLSDDIDPRTVWCPEGLDPYQPFFSCDSPRALFDLPLSKSSSRPFALVTVYKTYADREATKELITRFVEDLESLMP